MTHRTSDSTCGSCDALEDCEFGKKREGKNRYIQDLLTWAGDNLAQALAELQRLEDQQNQAHIRLTSRLLTCARDDITQARGELRRLGQ